MTHLKHSLVLLLSLANPVQALQVVDAHDGETVLAKILRVRKSRGSLLSTGACKK